MKLLFICTHNRCRSILCEAMTRHLAGDRITAWSAGSQPVDQVHPLTLKYLQEKGIAVVGLKSQSWDEFSQAQPDAVITVCDSAANESCPLWLGQAIKAHWGLPDPSRLDGSDAQIKAAFDSVMNTIEQRIKALLALDFAAMSPTQLQAGLQALAGEA